MPEENETREAETLDPSAIADVAESVAQLRTAVTEVRDGLLDRETVERIVTETMERQSGVRGGFRPDDTPDAGQVRALGGTPEQRAMALHTRSATSTARVTRHAEADVRHFQETADGLVLLGAILGAGERNFDVRSTRYYEEEFAPALRALDTATTGEGTEWVPTNMSANLIERVNLQLRVAALFPMVQMPTKTFDLPGLGLSRVRTGSHAEQTADTGQTKFKAITPATRKVSLTAVKFAARCLVSKEEEEDAIVAVLPVLQTQIVEFLSADLEDAIINGDTTGTHQDSDTTDADDPRKIWLGLRKLIPAGAKHDAASVAALTLAHLRKNRKLMGKYGVNPAKLAHIVSMAGYIQLLDDPSVLTIDKYGPQATVVSGELAKVDGVPVVVSEYVRSDLNATGVYDGTTTTEQIALTAHRDGYVLGERRGMTVEYLRELYAESDQDAIVASTRKAFTKVYGTDTTGALAYNVDS